MNKILLVITIFLLGFVSNDFFKKQKVNLTSEAHAKIDGKSWSQLVYDDDFKKAVKWYITNQCNIEIKLNHTYHRINCI